MKSDYLPIDDGASDLAWRFRNSANVPNIELSVAIRAYGDQCRRAGAEAAADLAWRAMNDGVSLQGACDLIRALPSAEAASSRQGDLPSLEDAEAILRPGHPLYTSPEQAARAAETMRRGAALVAEAASPAAGWRLVPIEPTEVQWGGLARDVIMWTRFPDPTGKALHQHLRRLGRLVPDWLLAEIPDTDRVPPKGCVAVAVYKLMVEALDSPSEEARTKDK